MKVLAVKIFAHMLPILVCGSIFSCASTQQAVNTAKDAVILAKDACVVIHDVAPNNEKGQEICAREEELQPFLKLILGGRAKAVSTTDGGVK